MPLFQFRKSRPGRPVVFYTRQGCHLCDDAVGLLRQYERTFRLEITIVDIDSDPALAARYGDKVPVVVIDGRERFFGQVDGALLRRVLRAAPKK